MHQNILYVFEDEPMDFDIRNFKNTLESMDWFTDDNELVNPYVEYQTLLGHTNKEDNLKDIKDALLSTDLIKTPFSMSKTYDSDDEFVKLDITKEQVKKYLAWTIALEQSFVNIKSKLLSNNEIFTNDLLSSDSLTNDELNIRDAARKVLRVNYADPMIAYVTSDDNGSYNISTYDYLYDFINTMIFGTENEKSIYVLTSIVGDFKI